MDRKTIYPNVEFRTAIIKGEVDEYITSISTYLRKQHTDGKWYLQFIHNDLRSESPTSVGQCVKDFNHNVYLALLSGKVIPGP